MEEELIKYETALLARDKGFDEICYHGFVGKETLIDMNYRNSDDLYLMQPTQALLQKWLREVHNLIIIIDYSSKASYTKYYFTIKNIEGNKLTDSVYWDTYEECLEVALFESFKLIKDENVVK